MNSGTRRLNLNENSPQAPEKVSLVLSGGGSRAAYQVGALQALAPYIEKKNLTPTIIVGSSMGAINGIVFAAGLKYGFSSAATLLESIWSERTYANTFTGSISRSFIRTMQVAILRYRSPGPAASAINIFDPSPLRQKINQALEEVNGISATGDASALEAVAVMTTVEGITRKPLLLCSLLNDKIQPLLKGATFELCRVSNLNATHGLASAALPSVLPAVDLDLETRNVRLVDGGICDNVPVDPAVRLGSNNVIVIDSSGRRWWFDHYGQPHDTRESWEVPAAESTFCLCPFKSIECMNISPLGPLLKEAVGRSTKDFLIALGPTWPVFRILKHKMGEALAYEVMSYVALHPQYIEALRERGYEETNKILEREGFQS